MNVWNRQKNTVEWKMKLKIPTLVRSMDCFFTEQDKWQSEKG